jgi:glutamate carboxypeptidase
MIKAEIAGAREGPGILLLAHLDTVHPSGTIDGPLPWRRDGDKIYGPGCYDMKGGTYLAYYAMRQIVAAGKTPTLPVTFLLIPDEEVGSPSTRARIEAEARGHGHVLVPEPSKEGNLVTGRHAFQRFTIRAKGRPAHAGSTLARGRSAIREIAEQIIRLEGMGDPERGITLSVGVVNGGQWVNVVPIECEAQVLVVTPTPDGFDDIRAHVLALEAINDDIELTVEPGPVRPLFEPSDGTMALYELAREIAEDIGFSPGHGSYGGGSDGNFTGALGIPTLDGLGVMGDGAHTHNEHLLVSSLVPRARLLAGLFEQLGQEDYGKF